MSRTIGNKLIRNSNLLQWTFSKTELRSGILVKNNILQSNANFSSSKRDKLLGQGSILLQQGIDIQELPVIIRKADNNDFIFLCNSVGNGNGTGDGRDRFTNEEKTKEIEDFCDNESLEMVNGFKRCYSAKGVFTLLDTIPIKEITPKVALEALKTIIYLENNHSFRNPITGQILEEKQENFTRTAVLTNLIDLIASSKYANTVLDGLRVASKEALGANTDTYRQKLCNEVLIRVCDGQLNITQVCTAINLFTILNCPDVDKLWVGILEKQNFINENNILEIFKVLPYIKQSRRLVLNILETILDQVWYKLKSKDIAEILNMLTCINFVPRHMIEIVSRWVNTNIHTINEDDLLSIVRGCLKLDSSEQGVEKALERYMKAKGLKIQDPAVFAAVLEYCKKFRFRSTLILDAGSQYFIDNSKKLTPVVLKSMFCTYGALDFQPTNSIKFWEVLEAELEDKFVQMRTEDALDIILSCVYLRKFPLNFVKKVFNPYFLDRLHSSTDPNLLQVLRSKLKLFDTAMTLECDLYRGPLLPKDSSSKSLWQDGRIRRMTNFIIEVIQNLPSGYTTSSCVILNQLPFLDLYVVDLLLHTKTQNFLNFKKDVNYAVLIHVPEHYDLTGSHLIGPQIMRRRHFEGIGLNVIDLDFVTISKLRLHSSDLHEYLISKIPILGVNSFSQ